ncbi:MAG TPA: class I SAM-dependent methyltransferase [Acidobacteriaceae bacterium]|nr:class I SAM-dependent methyltransferase [Acidobacteriaceae bacterium]
MSYTFGDHEEASLRLRRLAAVYEPETRRLLELLRDGDQPNVFRLAVDLGCGPGWTTQLLDAVLKPQRTVGLDSSERYIAEARINCPKLEFMRHDILQTPFPVGSPDLFLCRFLLTHLPSPQTALRVWAGAAAPQAKLLIHETEWFESTHPALRRYYQLVDEMQRHYGQELKVGAILDVSIVGTGWQVQHSRSLVLEKSAGEMAQLHLPNLRTWGRNEFAAQAFDRRELDELEATLDSIASGVCEAGIVCNSVKQIVAERE